MKYLHNVTFALVVMLGALTIAQIVSAKETIVLKGSDTMLLLGQGWAETYMAQNTEAVIQVNGGGSGVGFAALINGSTDICQASRPIKTSEIEKLKERFNSPGVEIPVARDGLSVYLNSDNPVTELTMAQLKAIYVGTITNWKEVGGKDARIILYGRENSSGTYSYFKEHVLKGADFAPQTQGLPGTGAVVNAVLKDANAIGFGGAAYAKNLKICRMKADASSPSYEPTLENVASGLYPISRNLYWYLTAKPSGEIKKFIDFVQSETGQKIVTKVGYYPVK